MFLKRGDPYLLIVGMTGVKMGDRVVFVGCAHGGRLAAVASKVGLSGSAVAMSAFWMRQQMLPENQKM